MVFASFNIGKKHMTEHHFNWSSEVRGYETDFQGIVNNAVYFNYLDHTRCLQLAHLGVDIKTCAENQLNLVLIHTELSYKHSLTVHDSFLIHSIMTRLSPLKYAFAQSIRLRKDNRLILTANSICCGVNAQSGKPCVVPQLAFLLRS